MDDLKLIKKYFGEEMMHLCRSLFPTILDESGKLFNILDNNFQRTKYLYKYIEDNKLELKFKDYIYSLLDYENIYTKSKKIYMPKLSLDFASSGFCAKIIDMKKENGKVYLKDWKC